MVISSNISKIQRTLCSLRGVAYCCLGGKWKANHIFQRKIGARICVLAHIPSLFETSLNVPAYVSYG